MLSGARDDVVAVEDPDFELAVGEHAANAAVDRAERELCDEAADAVPDDDLDGVRCDLELPLPGFDSSGGTPGAISQVGSSNTLTRPIVASASERHRAVIVGELRFEDWEEVAFLAVCVGELELFGLGNSEPHVLAVGLVVLVGGGVARLRSRGRLGRSS